MVEFSSLQLSDLFRQVSPSTQGRVAYQCCLCYLFRQTGHLKDTSGHLALSPRDEADPYSIDLWPRDPTAWPMRLPRTPACRTGNPALYVF